MRLSKREVLDFNEIVDMMNRCQVAHIGYVTEDVPYIVPVSFGYKVENESITLYFHGAKEGMKYECFQKNPYVSIEFDHFMGNMKVGFGYTARYESIMAKGKIIECVDKEKEEAMIYIMRHCGYPDFSGCEHLDRTGLFKIELENISAKRRL